MIGNQIKPLLIYTCLLLGGCSGNTKYQIVEPAPTLNIALPGTTVEYGQPLTGKLSVTQQGEAGQYSVSVFIRQGDATITLDGSQIPTSGAWKQLASKSAQIVIKPTQTGDLILSAQVRSAEGTLSNTVDLTITVTDTAETLLKAACDAKVVNPTATTTLPVTLTMSKAGYEGLFRVTASITQGGGAFLYDGHVVTDTQINLASGAVLQFQPAALGEQIFEISATAGGQTATTRAYVDVVKQITVASDVQDCFTISGVGEHNTEGQTLTLALVNESLYNFEVAGWYDSADKLLSADPTCTIKLSRDCASDLKIRLKQRIVNLSVGASTRFETPVIGGGVTTSYRAQILGDYRTSDRIVLRYKDNSGNYVATVLDAGVSRGTYMWDSRNEFSTRIHQSDNPGLTFNFSKRYIESASTRYIVSSKITMKD